MYRLRLYIRLSVGHNHERYKNGLTDRGSVWSMDSGGTKEPCVGWGPGLLDPSGEGTILGIISRLISGVRSIFLTLFGRWQQRCDLSLSVVQQLSELRPVPVL